jgi:hypothetical protein
MREPSSIKPYSPGMRARWRARVSESRQQRLLSMRTRQKLAASLRRAATCRPVQSRHAVLLHDRVALVRDQLLEIALLLERDGNLDGSWILDVHRLVTDGCESPLYNREVHISELWAALYYLLEPQQVDALPLD